MLTETLAKFVVETGLEDIPDAVTQRAKLHVLDILGVMLAGSREDVGRLIIRYIKKRGGVPEAHVMSGDFQTSPPLAALANGTMGHILDFDDDSETMLSHPSTTLLPAVMALGGNNASGKDILAAFILGEEVSARIARIPALMPEHYEQGWHPTATLGAMGAAAAAAKILKLNVGGVRNALGIAASEAGGACANFGYMTKPYHAGSTASKAVSVALLAAEGLTANPCILESVRLYRYLRGGTKRRPVHCYRRSRGKLGFARSRCQHQTVSLLLFHPHGHRFAPECHAGKRPCIW